MNAKAVLFWTGAAGVAVGAGLPMILPSLPGSIQSNETLQPIGSFIINNQGWIALVGLILMLIGLFIV